MARNLKFFFDKDGTPRARGPGSERLLMSFLETDVQGSDFVCHDLMDDITAIEDASSDRREFIGNAHTVTMTSRKVVIRAQECTAADSAEAMIDESGGEPDADNLPEHSDATTYVTALKHFREILEDWEAFILDDQSPT